VSHNFIDLIPLNAVTRYIKKKQTKRINSNESVTKTAHPKLQVTISEEKKK